MMFIIADFCTMYNYTFISPSGGYDPSIGIHTNEDLYIVMAKLGRYLREQGYDINRLRGVSVDAPHGTIIIDTRYC